ncbi:MAG: transporter [Deltaproteobacteria bacterium]|nr:transporter [Deltaproteobacteria bacterium]
MAALARAGLPGLLAAACVALGASWAGAAPPAGDVNTGQDFTQPVTRAELRVRYQRAVEEDDHNTAVTARVDDISDLGGGWRLALRADLPYQWTDTPTGENPDGELDRGLGDALVQALLVAPVGGKWAYVLGTQVILPTARKDAMGTGKYQLVPTLGAKYDLGQWSRGAWCGALVRHAFDVASKDDERAHVSQTYLQPFVNILLPRLWFLTFAPEVRYDWREKRWFAPFDLMVGKMVSDRLVVSLEYKSAVVDDLPLYKHEVEARVGLLF